MYGKPMQYIVKKVTHVTFALRLIFGWLDTNLKHDGLSVWRLVLQIHVRTS